MGFKEMNDNYVSNNVQTSLPLSAKIVSIVRIMSVPRYDKERDSESGNGTTFYNVIYSVYTQLYISIAIYIYVCMYIYIYIQYICIY
jgi:hypothetical protein